MHVPAVAMPAPDRGEKKIREDQERGRNWSLFFAPCRCCQGGTTVTEGEEKLAAAAADVTQNGQTRRRRGLLFGGVGGGSHTLTPNAGGAWAVFGQKCDRVSWGLGSPLVGRWIVQQREQIFVLV